MHWTPAAIIALRGSLELSRRGFAERIGASERAVRRWESGASEPLRVYQDAMERERTALKGDAADLVAFGAAHG